MRGVRQGVNEAQCKAIANALVLMPSIESIDLVGNAIGRAGAESLGRALAMVDQPTAVSAAATPSTRRRPLARGLRRLRLGIRSPARCLRALDARRLQRRSRP
jgi:hypothetical protein